MLSLRDPLRASSLTSVLARLGALAAALALSACLSGGGGSTDGTTSTNGSAANAPSATMPSTGASGSSTSGGASSNSSGSSTNPSAPAPSGGTPGAGTPGGSSGGGALGALRRFTLSTIESNKAPWGKGMADLDGDGLVDLVASAGENDLARKIVWYRAPNWQRFEIATTSGGEDDLQIADINGDGALDIVISGTLAWFENPRGRGGDPRDTWRRHDIDFTSFHDLVIADVNGDRKPDVLTRASMQQPTVLYLQGATPDEWTKVVMANASEGLGLAVADIDRDGRADIVGNGYWLRQPANPASTNWQRFEFGAWPRGASVAVVDMNGDGRVDIVLAASEVGEGDLAWYEAPADPINGTWTKHVIGRVTDVHRFFIRDVNRDGRPDAVFAEMHQSPLKRVGVFYNNGNGSWTLQVIAQTGAHNIAVGDVGADGELDILGANWNLSSPDGGAINLWRNNGPQ